MKKLWTIRMVLVGLVLILGLLLSACGGEEAPAAEQPAAEQPAEQTVAQPTEQAAEQTPEQTTEQQPTAESAKPAAPASGQEGSVDTGFKPGVDGFSQENYGGEITDPQTGQSSPVVNLTSVEMRRMFGDAVCAAPAGSDGACTLIPPAEQWMEQNNSAMSGGHCEGFAVLSQLIFDKAVDPNPFGAAQTFDLKIPGNEALQREIAYWWATQGPVKDQNKRLAPKDAVDYLTSAYKENAKSLISIGIYKEDGSGGHAITSYGVQNQGNGIYWIMVYDNNYPGQERHMTLDLNANTWEYEASINPSVEPDVYKGGVENPIEFTPDKARLTVFPCDFCNGTSARKGGSGLAAATQQYNEIWTEGYVNVELQDDKGRKIGYDEKGKLVNEITEARLRSIRANTLSEVPPVIEMPTGMNFTAFIWGDDKAAQEPASLVMIGKGFYIGIDGLAMAPGQEDQLYFEGTGDALNYTTDAQESPEIIVGIEKPEADFELVLKAVEVSKGTDISVNFDQKEDVFAFQTTSDAAAKFSVSITRIGTDGKEETFDTGDSPIDVGPGKMMYFYFGKWQGQGSNLEIGYDENGNGTIEDSEISNMADAK